MSKPKSAKKKIALVYDAIYPYVKGGGEKRFHEIGRELTRQGYEVHLYGMKFWDGPNVIKRNGMYVHGLCKARPLNHKSGRRSITQPLIFGLSCLKLIREDFDVIDCCGFPYFSLFSCKLVTVIKRKPLHATWHEVWGKNIWRQYLGRAGRVGYWVEYLAVKMPNRFFAVSDHTASLLKKHFHPKQPVSIVSNGIHTEEIKSIKKAALKSDIIYTGRLTRHKHIEVLLKAVSVLKAKRPDVTCLVVGEGPMRASLEKLCKELQLDSNIIFKGFIPEHQEIISHMKASKVFVLPSTREGFGLVALEANAAGIPVITTAHSENAARTLINGLNGAAYKLDPQAFADGIDQSLNGQYARADCEAIAEEYDWTNIVTKLVRILG